MCLPQINLEEEIKYDLGLRKEIDAYHPNQRESEKKILENEPCQPCRCIFPCSQIGEEENLRRFQPEAAMKLVKTYLSNKIGDEHLSNRLVCYVEKEEFKKKSYQ